MNLVRRILVLLCALVVLGACTEKRYTTPTVKVTPPNGDLSFCEEDIPFRATFLPRGFRNETIPGPFPGGRAEDDLSTLKKSAAGKRQVIVHYRGPGGRAIEIRRPGTLFIELAQRSDAPTIEVLGTETAGFAPIGPGGDEFIVTFPYPRGAKPHRWCAHYSLNEYGVSLAKLKKVAEGLRPSSPEKPLRLLIHCGLSYPLEFDGRNWLPVDTRLRRSHNPPDGFGNDENYDMGTVQRIDRDTIVYSSSEGVEVEYEPTSQEPEGCE
jgi:hypothetical protein